MSADDARIKQLTNANKAMTQTLERLMRDSVLPELAKLMLSSSEPWNHEALAPEANAKHMFPQKRRRTLLFYTKAFSLLRQSPRRILEIGVKRGMSLELWKNLFPDASIVGIDIVPPKQPLSEGITVIQADQGKPETIAAVGAQFGPFDVVIDDGSHIGEHVINSLEALLPHLIPGGLYVIEDMLGRGQGKKGNVTDDGKVDDLASAAMSYFSQHAKPWRPPESSIQEEVGRILPCMDTMLFGSRILAFVLRTN
jgi:predicted O-methyltransferase YrrM